MSTMSISARSATKKAILFKCSLSLAGLLVLVELLAVVTAMHDADNQLVALEEEESNDLNGLNRGRKFESELPA